MKTIICYSIKQEILFLKNLNTDLFKIGVGKKKVIENLNKIIDKYDRFILIGFAGAVLPNLKVGDCFKFNSFYLYNENNFIRLNKDDKEKNKILCTVPYIFNKKDKEKLFLNNPDILAVDMESYFFIEILLKNKKECMVIKTISDNKNFIMPDFLIIKKFFNKISPGFFLNIFIHPIEMTRLIKLKINCFIAGKKLSKYVQEIIW